MSNEIAFLTTKGFSKKHAIPEHLMRTLVKQGKIPGFFQQRRFYVNERLALEALNTMSCCTTEAVGER